MLLEELQKRPNEVIIDQTEILHEKETVFWHEKETVLINLENSQLQIQELLQQSNSLKSQNEDLTKELENLKRKSGMVSLDRESAHYITNDSNFNKSSSIKNNFESFQISPSKNQREHHFNTEEEAKGNPMNSLESPQFYNAIDQNLTNELMKDKKNLEQQLGNLSLEHSNILSKIDHRYDLISKGKEEISNSSRKFSHTMKFVSICDEIDIWKNKYYEIEKNLSTSTKENEALKQQNIYIQSNYQD